MIKRLTRHGNSWALVIDKPILDLLKLDPEAPVEVSTDGARLVIQSAPTKARKAKINAASDRIHKRHGAAFKRLAE